MTKEISPKQPQNSQKNVESSLNVDLPSVDIASLFPSVIDSSHLLVGTGHDDFVASKIARAVEDVDATLLNMNVTVMANAENDHIIDLRVDHRDPERVARSLERYGYNILEVRASDGTHSDDMRERIDELLHYLSI